MDEGFVAHSKNLEIIKRDPPIAYLDVQSNGNATGVIFAPWKKHASPLFTTCAAILAVDNGQIGQHVSELMRTLQQETNDMELDENHYEKTCAEIREIHNVSNCNTREECNFMLNAICGEDTLITESPEEQYRALEMLRSKLDEQRVFHCRTEALRVIPTLPNYYDKEYEKRIEAIGKIPNGLVAYEYWSFVDGKMTIAVKDHYEPGTRGGFHAYPLAIAMLKNNGITKEALESLDSDDPNATDARACLMKFLPV